MKSFLIVTTLELPEAYFLVDKLLHEGQLVTLLNVQGRTRKQARLVLKRLWKRRGVKYVLGFILSKLFSKYYKDPAVLPFPEITESKIQNLRMKARYIECKEINSEETKQQISEISPDYILIAGAPVIKPYIYEQAKIGTLNRHLGLSPEYRGSDCPIWSMANNDFDKIGYTIHFLSKTVDGGDVLLQNHVRISSTMDFSQACAHVNRQGSEGYWSVIKSLIDEDMLQSHPQSSGGVHYPPATLSVIKKASKNLRHRFAAEE